MLSGFVSCQEPGRELKKYALYCQNSGIFLERILKMLFKIRSRSRLWNISLIFFTI